MHCLQAQDPHNKMLCLQTQFKGDGMRIKTAFIKSKAHAVLTLASPRMWTR